MNARQHTMSIADIAPHQRDVRPPIDVILVNVNLKVAELGRQLGCRDAPCDRLSQKRSDRRAKTYQEGIDCHDHRKPPSYGLIDPVSKGIARARTP
jgi:hypothetical protein